MFASWKLVGSVAAAATTALLVSAPVAAQSVFGTHTWQMQPYCNVVTLTLSSSPGGAQIAGFDNLCGASNQASAVGMASPNASGQVTLNFTIVTSPAARPVHVTAAVDVRTGNGVWTDSGGSSGTMVYGRTSGGLPPRPIPVTQLGPNVISTLEIAPGAVGGSDINSAEVQARVSGSCAAGQAMTGINANGTVTCASITGGGSGPAVAFKAGGHGTGNYLPFATFVDVPWTGARFNVGGGTFGGGNTTYTVPESGLYLLTTNVRMNGFQTTGTYCGGFRVNGTVVGLTCNKYITTPSVDTDDVAASTTVQLSAGDAVVVSLMSLIPGDGVRMNGSHFSEANFTVTRLQ